MLSRSDDEFRNFQNYTRLLDCDRNNVSCNLIKIFIVLFPYLLIK